MIFAMSLGNIVGLYLLAPVVKRELRGYRAKLANGEIQPTGNGRFRRERDPSLTK
jgi:AGCS family alanine or glycine:cation symporter